MPVDVSYVPEEDRLDLTFQGNVDVTLAQDICDICRQLRPSLRVCIIDLTHAERLFDSGVALLQLLHCHLRDLDVTAVILADRPEMRGCIATIRRRPRYPVPLRRHAKLRPEWVVHPAGLAPVRQDSPAHLASTEIRQLS